MQNETVTLIEKAEEKLRLAMLHSDIEVLDKLLAEELIFTNHLGHILTKQDDLNAHKSGLLNISVIKPSKERVQIIGETAIVTLQVQLTGSYAGVESEANFRFTRVWAEASQANWQVIVAHSSMITSS